MTNTPNNSIEKYSFANIFGDKIQITPQYASALNSLVTGQVPQSAIKRHPGKGGKMFDYISHAWATRQLQTVLRQTWSLDIISVNILPDGSAGAVVKLTLNIPLDDGEGGEKLYQWSMVEYGSFEGNEKMSMANRCASAVSRGLVRACMRAFGWGLDLYEKAEELTADEAWELLVQTVRKNKGDEKQLAKTLKEIHGFVKDDLIDPDKFALAYNLAYHIGQPKVAIPDFDESVVEGKVYDVATDTPETVQEKSVTPVIEQVTEPSKKEESEPELKLEQKPESELVDTDSKQNVQELVYEDIPQPEIPEELIWNFEPKKWSDIAEKLIEFGLDPEQAKLKVKKDYPLYDANLLKRYWRLIMASPTPADFAPTKWSEIESELERLGRNIELIKSKMKEEFNLFDPSKISEYWKYIQENF